MRLLIVHGDYSTIAKRQEKISPDVWKFWRYFEIFTYYSTISRGTPNDILRNLGWETLN